MPSTTLSPGESIIIGDSIAMTVRHIATGKGREIVVFVQAPSVEGIRHLNRRGVARHVRKTQAVPATTDATASP